MHFNPLLPVLLAAGCATPILLETSSSPGPLSAKPGEITAWLTLIDTKPRLGDPLRFRLELANGLKKPIGYPAMQVLGFDGIWCPDFDITGPDGNRVPPLRSLGQIGVGTRPALQPGDKIVLFSDSDLKDAYVIARPGRYRVKVGLRGVGPWKESRNIESNELEFEVAGGEPSSMTRLADSLNRACPPGWSVGVRKHSKTPPTGSNFKIVGEWEPWSGYQANLVKFAGERYKDDPPASISLRFTNDPQKEGDILVENTQWGTVHALANTKAQKAWPNSFERLSQVLTVER